ncbi:MAG: hypothetical protein M1825_001093 [Sarcosagium campestre]|nr:MAG: hypothetical protein M1825_001093 [Sarcosagium campestre]
MDSWIPESPMYHFSPMAAQSSHDHSMRSVPMYDQPYLAYDTDSQFGSSSGSPPAESSVRQQSPRSDVDSARRRSGDSAGGSFSQHDGNSSADTKLKRRAQNRASQRAFRDRKASYVRGLECKIASMESKMSQMEHSNAELLTAYTNLKMRLEDAPNTPEAPSEPSSEPSVSSASEYPGDVSSFLHDLEADLLSENSMCSRQFTSLPNPDLWY